MEGVSFGNRASYVKKVVTYEIRRTIERFIKGITLYKFMTDTKHKKTTVDLTELAKAILELTEAEAKSVEAVIPLADVKQIGNGGGHILVPGKYVGYQAKIEIFKKKSENKKEEVKSG